MSEPQLSLTADADFDDLPRTVRRERDARAREAREREARERDVSLGRDDTLRDTPRFINRDMSYSRPPYGDDPIPAAVKRFDVPFLRLVTFFIKAVLAAIPALLLLGALLWFAGHILQTQFPELIKMKILITFPNG
jgi:hypothetical protein